MTYKDEKELDDAISHLEEVLSDESRTWDCTCRKDHENLKGWLEELWELRRMIAAESDKREKLAAEKPAVDPKSPLGLAMQALSEPHWPLEAQDA